MKEEYQAEVVNEAQQQEILELRKQIADTENLTAMANLQTARINYQTQMISLLESNPEAHAKMEAEKQQKEELKAQEKINRSQELEHWKAKIEAIGTVNTEEEAIKVGKHFEYWKANRDNAQHNPSQPEQI